MKPKLVRITTIPISFVKLLEGQLAFMSQYYQVIAISSNESELKIFAQSEGVESINMPLTRKITPITDLKALWRLYCFFRKEKPDIVHTHTPKAGTIGMIAAKLAGVPIRMHTIAGLPLLTTTGKKRVLLNLVEKITYFCATNIYPNAYGLKKIILSECFCSEKKLKVLGNGSSNGININYFDPMLYTENDKNKLREQLQIELHDFVFVFVGRLVSDKGINELVSAFDSLSRKNKNVKLLLVGPQEVELDPLDERTLCIMSENSSIISVGYQEDVRPYFSISDTLTFPSYREGFPNVVMQAGAMGLPSIVSDINGCNEIVIHGKNGLLIPIKNKFALEESMKALFSQRDVLDGMKLVAREMITTRYQRQKIWDDLLIEYRRLLQS